MFQTEEQRAIVDAAVRTQKNGGSLKVNAGPGTGKTSTLVMIADALTNRTHGGRGKNLYLAYNKNLQVEAKQRFGDKADTYTLHAFANRCLGVSRQNRKVGNINPSDVKELLGLPSNSGSNSRARSAIQTLNGFTSSGCVQVSRDHAPRGLNKKSESAVTQALVDAQHLFDLIRSDNAKCPAPIPHDVYLKTWHVLGTPGLEKYGTILFDEAQDANPVMLSVLDQAPHIVSVGDRHQQINAWRGATNAMDRLDGEEYALTLSFRFGPKIAAAANRILDIKSPNESFRLRGNESVASVIGRVNVDQPHTRLYRKNEAAFEDLVFLDDIGRKPKFAGDIRGFVSKLEAAWRVHEGHASTVRHPSVSMFDSWDDLNDAFEDRSGIDKEVSHAVRMIKSFSSRMPEIIGRLKIQREESDALALIATAHRSKGEQWPQVLVASDFDSSLESDNGEQPPEDEMNLCYVAITRVINRLEIQSENLNELLRPVL